MVFLSLAWKLYQEFITKPFVLHDIMNKYLMVTHEFLGPDEAVIIIFSFLTRSWILIFGILVLPSWMAQCIYDSMFSLFLGHCVLFLILEYRIFIKNSW